MSRTIRNHGDHYGHQRRTKRSRQKSLRLTVNGQMRDGTILSRTVYEKILTGPGQRNTSIKTYKKAMAKPLRCPPQIKAPSISPPPQGGFLMPQILPR